MKPFYVRATFYDKFGARHSISIVDWNDRHAVQGFAGQANTTIRAGGAVHTKSIKWPVFKDFAKWLVDRDADGTISFTDWPTAAEFSESVLSGGTFKPDHATSIAALLGDWVRDDVGGMIPGWDVAYAFRMEVIGE